MTEFPSLVQKPLVVTTNRHYSVEIYIDRYRKVGASVRFLNGILHAVVYDDDLQDCVLQWKMNKLMVELIEKLEKVEKSNQMQLSDLKE